MNVQIRHLEEEVSDLKSAALTRESDLENALSRLRTVEDQYATLQGEHAKARNELEFLQREHDLLKVMNNFYNLHFTSKFCKKKYFKIHYVNK